MGLLLFYISNSTKHCTEVEWKPLFFPDAFFVGQASCIIRSAAIAYIRKIRVKANGKACTKNK